MSRLLQRDNGISVSDPEILDLFQIEDRMRQPLLSLVADPTVGQRASAMLALFYPDLKLVNANGKTTLAPRKEVSLHYPWSPAADQSLETAISDALKPLEASLRSIMSDETIAQVSIDITKNRMNNRCIAVARYSEGPLQAMTYYLVLVYRDNEWRLVDAGLASVS